MEHILNTEEFHLENAAVCLGKFDGIHKGHRVLISYINKCKERGLQSVVFNFALHPYTLFSKGEAKLIDTMQEKVKKLEELGVDILVSYPFTKETASMEPEEFIKKVLVDKVGAKLIVVGKDFRFGYQRKGNITMLKKYEKEYGYQLVALEKLLDDKQVVSSTRIRHEIKAGNMEKVAKLLEKPYTIIGEVIHGKQLGRTIGMPTINQAVPDEKIIPPKGVYVSKVIFQGKEYQGVTNVGNKPTVSGDKKVGVETHIIGYEGDLYGEVVTVELYHFLRPERKFSGVDELKKQMYQDMESAKCLPLPEMLQLL